MPVIKALFMVRILSLFICSRASSRDTLRFLQSSHLKSVPRLAGKRERFILRRSLDRFSRLPMPGSRENTARRPIAIVDLKVEGISNPQSNNLQGAILRNNSPIPCEWDNRFIWKALRQVFGELC